MAKHGKTIKQTIMRLEFATMQLKNEIQKCLEVYDKIRDRRSKVKNERA